ncbi:hypothetical protein COW20_15120 [bacterium (Candidatus Blackallbacteria) CG13_big_fil_rev_8_21_14_2_50_49_14]|nr:MAG: hypothetical protein COW64_16480 [bacterium (Candidatus Blackallbacteria) CG18_big_fil_WC_8_21_14_2_50_49_26]PIW46668.1 MAG: hypothetical protein COW20_15120 [bacterium (Candidatus Blackallbacteria) CG13_big_fil_rev_8_21_14_2_50_49_14]
MKFVPKRPFFTLQVEPAKGTNLSELRQDLVLVHAHGFKVFFFQRGGDVIHAVTVVNSQFRMADHMGVNICSQNLKIVHDRLQPVFFSQTNCQRIGLFTT